jgi:hypothetical protein
MEHRGLGHRDMEHRGIEYQVVLTGGSPPRWKWSFQTKGMKHPKTGTAFMRRMAIIYACAAIDKAIKDDGKLNVGNPT